MDGFERFMLEQRAWVKMPATAKMRQLAQRGGNYHAYTVEDIGTILSRLPVDPRPIGIQTPLVAKAALLGSVKLPPNGGNRKGRPEWPPLVTYIAGPSHPERGGRRPAEREL